MRLSAILPSGQSLLHSHWWNCGKTHTLENDPIHTNEDL
jgi:hypothetical protein